MWQIYTIKCFYYEQSSEYLLRNAFAHQQFMFSVVKIISYQLTEHRFNWKLKTGRSFTPQQRFGGLRTQTLK